ncbi:MAG: C4-dicarboxylate transporter DctA [Aliidongia sp.]
MSKFLRAVYGQVVIALILGVAIGMVFPETAVALKPLGDGFLKLIKMIVAPLVFFVIVTGIAGAGDLKKVGRVGVKCLVYFEALTTLALIVGIVLAYAVQPGAGMNVDPATLDAKDAAGFAKTATDTTIAKFLLNLIPDTITDAFARGDILQIMVFAIPFGFALALGGETAHHVVKVIDAVLHSLFRMMGFIVRLAPLGVLGAIGFTVGKYGIHSLAPLAMLLVVFYLACLTFVLVVLGLILRGAGLSIFRLIAYLKDELLIVAGTASSDAVIPQIMGKLEHLGISKATVGIVIPTGYSFNLDGFSIYLTLAVVFIAQATNTVLSTGDLIALLFVSLLTSKGAHGVPGSALVILAATLTANPALPLAGLGLVLAVDWFMGIGRALTNLVGNCVATVVIAAWERDLDRAKAQSVLSGDDDYLAEVAAPA